LETAGKNSQPFSFSLSNGKERTHQTWKVHPARKHLPAILSGCAAESYVRKAGQPMKAVELARSQNGGWRNISIALTEPISPRRLFHHNYPVSAITYTHPARCENMHLNWGSDGICRSSTADVPRCLIAIFTVL
jgi:hypothetical protein